MIKRTTLSLAILGLSASVAMAQPAAKFDTDQIEKITGLKGAYSQAENVFKVSKPRPEMNVRVNGWKIPPFMGTGSWAAFTPMADGQTMVMGDNVVYEDEVAATMSAALENGLEVTALHNHFFFEQPKVYFMHISGMGSASSLAGAVKKVLETPDRIRSASAIPAVTYPLKQVSQQSAITGEPLEKILGGKGEANSGMFKVTLGRDIKIHGMNMGNAMGVNTWAGFAGTNDNAVVDGDFAVLESELQSVLKSLRKSGIQIVAIHQHMTHEEPRMMFLHYWGQGKAEDLAKAVKEALILTATKTAL